jgi:hypothetical protein
MFSKHQSLDERTSARIQLAVETSSLAMVKRQRLDEEGSAEQDTSEAALMGVQEAEIEEAKQSATWEESPTMGFPEGLPMEYSYPCPKFYVRECYSTYYKIVLRLLRAPHAEVVTVTGASGGSELQC